MVLQGGYPSIDLLSNRVSNYVSESNFNKYCPKLSTGTN
jgi:hypothetical protein